MTTEELRRIIKNNLDGTASEEEIRILKEFEEYSKSKIRNKEFADDHERAVVKEEIYSGIQKRIHRKHSFSLLKITASIVLLLGLSFLAFWMIGRPTVQERVLVNSTNDPMEYWLPDSSKLVLNVGAEVRYDENGFSTDQRNVTLEGEAYFSVKRDLNVPFVVSTGEVSTRVVGTRFIIKETDQKVLVTVNEGLVKVYDKEDSIMVTPTEQVEYDRVSHKLIAMEINTSLVDYWLKESISLHNVTVAQMTNVMEAVYKVHFTIEDAVLASRRVSVQFDKEENLDDVIRRINLINEFQLIKAKNNMIRITIP